jgi:hypothetical protein
VPLGLSEADHYRYAKGPDTLDQELKEQVLATYTACVDAFRANDVSALDKLIQYSFAFIASGRVALVESFPIKPADLMAAKQWHDTKDLDREVVFLSADQACDRAPCYPGPCAAAGTASPETTVPHGE